MQGTLIATLLPGCWPEVVLARSHVLSLCKNSRCSHDVTLACCCLCWQINCRTHAFRPASVQVVYALCLYCGPQIFGIISPLLP